MFSITLFVNTASQPVVLLFKSEESLDKAITSYDSFDQMVMVGNDGSKMQVELRDDFGQRLRVLKPVSVLLIQDLQLAQQADIERGIHQAITQAKAQERAKSDPTLSAHMRSMQQGPAVLNPMGMPNGRFS